MKREIVTTADGSHTVFIPEMSITYRSLHGAVQESMHVFIKAGFDFVCGRFEQLDTLRIFELGFGTGLSTFLTAIAATETKTAVHYTTIEPAPLSITEASLLNYPDAFGYKELFLQIHECDWGRQVELTEYFAIEKINAELMNFSADGKFHLIYHDAFAPSAQPELWTEQVFKKLFGLLQPNGVLVTYCSKSDVRRCMMAAGFRIEKLPGPRGKREMVRATSPQPSPAELEREPERR